MYKTTFFQRNNSRPTFCQYFFIATKFIMFFNVNAGDRAMKIFFLPVLFLIFLSCTSSSSQSASINYRAEMRSFVIGISAYAKNISPSFAVIPQNGGELLSLTNDPAGPFAAEYINAIDGVGREDLYYGYTADDAATPAEDTSTMKSFTDIAAAHQKIVMAIDYCSTRTNMDDSYSKNSIPNYISFAADHRVLDNIPAYPAKPYNDSDTPVNSLADAKNFLYIINPSAYSLKSDFISALDATNYDVILIDLFFNDETLSAADIAALKTKPSGARRLVICYMSIGEAEDYRYYWKSSWNTSKPEWMDTENPDWAGNFEVQYWNREWQNIIYGNDASYLKKILTAGFDGVYLDLIDAYEYYENL
jgi:cysteinyl-tRNA synthetase, unknown class